MTLGTIFGVVGVILSRRSARGEGSARGVGMLYVWAVVPILFAIFECYREAGMFEGALAETTIGLEARGRVAAEGAAEVLIPMTLATIRSALLLCLAGFFVVRATAVSKGERSWIGPIAVVILSAGSHAFVRDALNGSDRLSVVVVVIAAVLIELVDVRRIGGPATLVAMPIAVLLIDIAAKDRNLSYWLEGVSGESVDPSQHRYMLRLMTSIDTRRVLLTALDVALMAILVFRRLRRSAESMPLMKWLETRWGLVSTSMMVVMATAVLSTLGWTRSMEHINGVGAGIAHLSWHKGSSPLPSASAISNAMLGDDISGPALILEAGDKSLYASTGPGVTPAPLIGQAIFDRMAQASTDNTKPPLLVVRGAAATTGIGFESVTSALSPLLAGRQYAYRLVGALGDADRSLGDFAGLLHVRGFSTKAIDIMPTLPISNSYAKVAEGKDGLWVGFFLDRANIRLLSLQRDDLGYRPGKWPLKESKLMLDSTERRSELGREVDSIVGRLGQANAVLAFDPATPIADVMQAVTIIDGINGDYGSPRRVGRMFTKIVVSPTKDAFEKLSRP